MNHHVNAMASHQIEAIKNLLTLGYADLKNVSGELNCYAMEYQIGNHALVIQSKSFIKITTQDGKDITLNGIVCCGMVKSIEVNHARIIVISNRMSSIKDLLFKSGLINVQHGSIIADLLDSVADIKRSYYNTALLAQILIFEQEFNKKQSDILSEIKLNAANPNYNLDSFCEKIHVSRRKAQYLLSEYETTFLHELKKNRVALLKELIGHPKNRHKSKAYLAYQAGFKNLQSAQRDFLLITQTPLNKYINLINITTDFASRSCTG